VTAAELLILKSGDCRLFAKQAQLSDARDTVRVLVIDDSVEDVRRVRGLLQEEGEFRLASARDVEEARGLLEGGNYDVALVDYRLWSDDNAGLVRFVRERYPDVAIVLLTSGDNEREALPALKLGATTFSRSNTWTASSRPGFSPPWMRPARCGGATQWCAGSNVKPDRPPHRPLQPPRVR
jgi:CheY-like chemotaxis protein